MCFCTFEIWIAAHLIRDLVNARRVGLIRSEARSISGNHLLEVFASLGSAEFAGA